jgi:hypothetical protein
MRRTACIFQLNSCNEFLFLLQKFKQSTAFIFPSQSLKRRFDELNGRMNDLEMEIKKMKTTNSQV